MTTVTIPRKLRDKSELVLIPKQEYEEFLRLQKIFRLAQPSHSEKCAITRGRKEVRKGHCVSWRELKHELARRTR